MSILFFSSLEPGPASRPLFLVALAACGLLAACNASPPEPSAKAETPAKELDKAPVATKTPKAALAQQRRLVPNVHNRLAKGPNDVGPGGGRKVMAKPVKDVPVSPDDPLKGQWSLDDATKGLPAGTALTAKIETDLGTLSCKLFSDKAPITVANFVGLARGTRPWRTPEGSWEKKPAYDGTIFHRIIKGFMIQGGDAKKNGSGEAGYVIPDEVWEDANHDRAGLLCMANRGPNTNSAQFFVTDAAAPHLDGGYTIFGECAPLDVLHAIAALPVHADRPDNPPTIKKVTIERK